MTELAVAAGVHNDQLFPQWLAELGVDGASSAKAHVRSQIQFPQLKGHESASRVDLVVELAHPERTDLVFMEVKQNAPEGSAQLERYADHLELAVTDGRKWLVYVTKSFSPKNPLERPSIGFRQGQWHQFYRLLKQSPQSDLNREILSFMETTGQSQENRFTPLDLLVMRNMKQTFSLMEAALAGPVLAQMRLVTGGDQLRARMKEVARIGFWGYQFQWEQRGQSGVLISAGFSQPTNEDPQSYPCISVGIHRDSKAFDGRREELRRAMAAAVQSGDRWEGLNLDNANDWFGMQRVLSLDALCHQPDHVKACEKFLLDGLNAVETFIKANSNLRIRPPDRERSGTISADTADTTTG